MTTIEELTICKLAENATTIGNKYAENDKFPGIGSSATPYAFGHFQADMRHLLEALNLNKKQIKILENWPNR